MTTERRLATDLPNILGDLAGGPYPEYIDDVLTRTAHTRQRPAWTFPERWLRMTEIARQPVLVPRLPWRSISMVLVLIALLVAAAAVLTVGTPQRLPAPYGPARNGLVAYEAGGDIYTAEPVSGAATAIVTGPETDIAPRFSRDGTQLAFFRALRVGVGQLYVAASDGSQLTLVTPEPVVLTDPEVAPEYEFSPDGQSLLFMSLAIGEPRMSIARTDGSGVRLLDVGGMTAEGGTFRPPDGAEILFVGEAWPNVAGGNGLFAIDVASGVVRPVVEPSNDVEMEGGTWSPDGSQIAYWSWDSGAETLTPSTHVISAQGTGDRVLPAPAGAVWNAGAAWSNDGTRVFLFRGYTPDDADVRAAVIPADGSSVGVEIPLPRKAVGAWTWAPDDSMILGVLEDDLGPTEQVIVDPVARTSRDAPWATTSHPTWQRLAR